MRLTSKQLVTVGYVVGGAFVFFGLIHIGLELYEQYQINRDLAILRAGRSEAEVSSAQEDLVRRDVLIYLITYLDMPAHHDKTMRVCQSFERLVTGYPDRISKRQKRAVKAMMRGKLKMPEGLDLSSLYPKLEEFLEGKTVIFDLEEEQVMERACEMIRMGYDATLSRAMDALKMLVRRRLDSGKGIPPVQIGEISRLLERESPSLREGVREILTELGADSYKWLKKLLERTPNPILAQETDEYKEEEREAQLHDRDLRAKREAILLLLEFGTPEAQEILDWAKEEPQLKDVFVEALASAPTTSGASAAVE